MFMKIESLQADIYCQSQATIFPFADCTAGYACLCGSTQNVECLLNAPQLQLWDRPSHRLQPQVCVYKEI